MRRLPLLALGVAACAGQSQSAPQRDRTPPVVASAQPEEIPPAPASVDAGAPLDAGQDEPPAPSKPACATVMWADACVANHEYTTPEVEDLDAWFREHHATPPQHDIPPQCHETSVGPAGEPALLCEGIVHIGSGSVAQNNYVFRVTVRVTLRVVRNKRVVTLFDAPTLVDMLDKDEPSGPLFALNFELRPGASELVLSEPGTGACDAAAKRLDAELASARREPDPGTRVVMSAWARFDRDALRDLCKATGTYHWKNGRFVRAKAPLAPSSGASSGASGP